MKRKIRFSLWEISLIILLLIQVVLMIYANLTLMERTFDSDAGMIMNHVMMMAKEKTILIKDWVYPSTLEFDSTALFALPLYLLTKNIFLSFALSNIILLGLFACTVFYLFDDKEKVYPVFALNLLLIPYTIGALEYYNMLFFIGAQYIIKVTIPLLLIALLLHVRKNRKEKPDIRFVIVTILYGGLVFLTGFSSGVYVVFCGLFPIFAVYVLYKFFRPERIWFREWLLAGVTAFCSLAGIFLNMRSQTAKGNSMMFMNVYDLWSNIYKCFFGIFEIMGGATRSSEMAVVSGDGIQLFIKMMLTILLIGSVFAAGYRFKKDKTDVFFLLAVSVPAFNFFILCITNTRYGSLTFEYRYHLIGLVPVFCIFSRILLDWLKKQKKWQKNWICGSIFLVFLYLNFVSFLPLKGVEDVHAELKQVIEYCKGLGVDTVYYLDDNQSAENSRVLDDELLYLRLHGNGTSLVRDYYLKYDGNPIWEDENYVVVVNYWEFPWEETVDFNGFVMLERLCSIGGRGIYTKMK